MSGAPDDRAAEERLLALAAGAAPPPLAPTDARRMVRRALLAGAARGRATERTTFWLALGGLAAVALVATWLRLAPEGTRAAQVDSAPPLASAALRMQLPSRDTLVATPGARFELVNADPRDRRIELQDGAIAFDVAKLGAGQSFAVVTPHVTVRVRGTVFSVAASVRRTEVRVYEGVVAVDVGGGERLLRQGESYASDGTVVAQDAAAPLQHDAVAMAARRAQEPARVETAPAAATVSPAVEPAPAVVQLPARERVAEPRARAADTLQQARAWLHDGQAERALAATLRADASGTAPKGDWLLLRADALRSLGQRREAALAYLDAALALPGERRAQAGFKAADMLLRELDDPHGALAALHAAGVDDRSSALRERGLLLRVEALERSGQSVAEVARRYLAEYPDSAGAPRLRALLEGR